VSESTFIQYPSNLSALHISHVVNRLLKQMSEPSSLPSSSCQGSHRQFFPLRSNEFYRMHPVCEIRDHALWTE